MKSPLKRLKSKNTKNKESSRMGKNGSKGKAIALTEEVRAISPEIEDRIYGNSLQPPDTNTGWFSKNVLWFSSNFGG